MISHKYQCIFIHIPKCASTSIEAAFGHFEGGVQRGIQDHRSIRMLENPFLTRQAFSSAENIAEILRRLKLKYLSSVKFPQNRQEATASQYRSYFKFTFIRNPWSRAFSWYVNVMSDEILRKEYGVAETLSFQRFLEKYGGKGPLRPQLYWMKDFSGALPFDAIGRYENLVEDFRRICEMMGVKNMSLPHENKSKRHGVNYREQYSAASRQIVAEIYREEIELFGYSFDG